MQRQDYESARESLLSSSYSTFNKSGQRFLDVCSQYGPARRAIEAIRPTEVVYDRVRDALENHEDPTPVDGSGHLPFCLGLFRAVINGGEDAAPLLGVILSGCNKLDMGLYVYRTQFLRPLIGHIDRYIAQAETKRTSRSDRFVKAAWLITAAVLGGFLTKLGEWLWRVLAG